MADWDADSPQLHQNLIEIRVSLERDAERRIVPAVALAKAWQTTMMAGLTISDPLYVGRFRGETGLENCRVSIGSASGVPPADVANELTSFETRLQAAVSALDGAYPVGVDLDTDGLAAVIDLAAWAHAEWVRIHPFANGNGRTARVWANWIFVRYGFPPAVRLRPRPESGYGAACARAMATDGSSLPRHGARRYGAADLSGNVNHHVPELSTDRWRAPSNRSTWTTRSAPSVTRSASSVSRPSSPPRPF